MAVGDPVLYVGYLGAGGTVYLTFNTRVKITAIYSNQSTYPPAIHIRDASGADRHVGYARRIETGGVFATVGIGNLDPLFLPAGTTIRLTANGSYGCSYVISGVEY